MSTVELLERKQAPWEKMGTKSADARIGEYVATELFSPAVTVKGDSLEIDSTRLEVERVYPFDYLGVKLVLWKLSDNTIDIFQLIEE
ncbi:hypothetical protein MUP77_03170 [Candidatus Bathyarchaeota archaeon]|nr:hypothetical protein [Candidatus Bathyarchaeota archaeon]